ncbi:MAG TPA: hypothetical protein VK888_02320 [Anaerolineales bacterium]|nr:hypothetical protein [Anaerolineales bacterium]
MGKQILKNDFLQIEYLTNSLRITGLTPAGKSNLLAVLSDLAPIPTPYGEFYFHGGHRLWHAPESMPRTYIPDAGELRMTELTNGVFLETRTEPGTGIRKQIEIILAPDTPSVRLTHTLVNDGLWPVELAPWAISQFRLGGTVILPMPVGDVDPAGLLPNRQISFWPYARINDPRLKLDDKFVLFKADALLPPFKFGYFNPHGWMAYWLDGVLFRKTFEVRAGQPHPDHNCNAELYCNDRFVELESLGPLTVIRPNESVTHVETWEVQGGLDALPSDVPEALAS